MEGRTGVEAEDRGVGLFEEGYEGGEGVAEGCGGFGEGGVMIGGGGDKGGGGGREWSRGKEVGVDCGGYNCEMGHVEGEHDRWDGSIEDNLSSFSWAEQKVLACKVQQ